MTPPRYIGARIDGEIVFLDRQSSCLIHLDADAIHVWETCPAAGQPAGGGDAAEDRLPPHTAAILAELERAGLVIRTHGRRLRQPVEWA